jgi:selenocysteine lyase/cysteine desulfurase
MAAAGIDFLALSGHQLYAPFGAGALVGDRSALGTGAPLLQGGGAIELVTLDDVIWADAPERHEAGSPNVVGVVALAAACRALLDLGMETVAAHEGALSDRACGAGSQACRACAGCCSGRPRPTAWVSRPSPSTATGTRCSRRS